MTGRLITVRELCERFIPIAEATAYDWRARGIGPASFKLNGRVVYDEDDVRAYIEQARVEAASTVSRARVGLPAERAS